MIFSNFQYNPKTYFRSFVHRYGNLLWNLRNIQSPDVSNNENITNNKYISSWIFIFPAIECLLKYKLRYKLCEM